MDEYKIVNATQLDADLQTLADAIRTKAGTTGKLSFPAGMKTAVDGLQTGGGLDGAYVVSVVSEAPEIGAEAFLESSVLERAEFSLAETIGRRAFYGCTWLMECVMPSVRSIGDEAFARCDQLYNLEFPMLTTIGAEAFAGCFQLNSISCPEVTVIGDSAFEDCNSLQTILLPNLETIPVSAFRMCMGLQTADFANVREIEPLAFSDSALRSLVLRREGTVDLMSRDALQGTPIEQGDGYIYVPSERMENYQTGHPEWSSFSAQFRALEDYTVDGTITGDLDESRI